MTAPPLSPSRAAAVDRALANEHLVQAVGKKCPGDARSALAAGEDPDAPGMGGTPLLATAVWLKQDWLTAALLIEHGASIDVNLIDETLLHAFARHNQIDLACHVLERGVPVDIRTRQKRFWTPLMIAAAWGRDDMVAFLIDRQAVVTTPDAYGAIPLHHARTVSITAQLLAAGAPVDARSGTNSTPLMLHAMRGHTSSCQILLDHGAHIHALNDLGATPLLESANTGQFETTALLLDRGADPSLGAIKGQDFQWYCEHDPELSIAYASWRAQRTVQNVLAHPAGLRGARG